MITVDRSIEIHWAVKKSYFTHYNKLAIGAESYPRKIGSSLKAVNSMISRGEEMKVLMPSIIGLDPSSGSANNWEAAVKRYWDGLSVDIPSDGKKLDIGWRIDINDPTKTVAIAALKKDNPSIKDEESLKAYLFDTRKDGSKNIPEEYLFRYATPTNIQDYLLWRYTLTYKDVAIDASLVHKSEHIRFYLHDEAKAKEQVKSHYLLKRKATQLYLDVVADGSKKDQILAVLGESLDGKDDTDKDILLERYSSSQPIRFIDVCEDKNLQTKALIEEYINVGILKRIGNTQIITDGEDPSLVLGNTIAETVSWFSRDTNKALSAEYNARYQALVGKGK